MFRRVIGSGLLAVCVFSGGCKSGSDAEPIAKDQFASTYAQAICDSFAGCCSSAHFAFDAANCKGSSTTSLQSKLDEQLKLSVTYSAEAAGECLAKLRGAMKCGSTDAADGIAECGSIFAGTLENGQACKQSDECKSGHCEQTAQVDPTTNVVMTTGVCSATASVVHGKLGQSCDADCYDAEHCSQPVLPGGATPSTTSVYCLRSEGLTCVLGQTNATCQALSSIGGPCGNDGECKEGLFCDTSGPGVCTAPHPNGASCNEDFECQSGNCDGGSCAELSVTSQACANGKP